MSFFKRFIYKFILILTIILLFFIVNINNYIYASELPTTYSDACILMDADSGTILYSKNAYDKMYPASTTKVMTAILTLENCNLNDVVTVDHYSVYNIPSGYSIANLHEGEQVTVDELLHVLLIPSANDAAFALADYIAGSVDKFSDMMNAKAASIGCQNTHFVNPNGIHNDDHYTTAYDLALMGQYAMKFDTFKEIVSMTRYTLPATNVYAATDRIFNTTNNLLVKGNKYYYQYATGAKTGYTEAAKNCIIATATKNDMNLIVVVLHGLVEDSGLKQRETDCISLFDYGFDNYSRQSLISKNSIQKTISISNASSDTKNLNLLAQDDLYAIIPNNYDISSITPNIVLNTNLSAPITEGTILGTITYEINNKDYTVNLVAANNVYEIDYLKIVLQIVLICIVLLMVSSILKRINHTKKKKSMKNSKYTYKNNISKSSHKKRKKSKHGKHDGFYPNF